MRWLRNSCSITISAAAKARSVAARSPNSPSTAILFRAASHSSGAPGAMASRTSVTAGRGSYSTVYLFGCVARGKDRFGDHDGDRFAHVTHALYGQRKMRLVENGTLRRADEGGQVVAQRVARNRHVADALAAVRHVIGAGENGEHAGANVLPRPCRLRGCARGRAASARRPRGPDRAARNRRCSARGRARGANPRSGAAAGRHSGGRGCGRSLVSRETDPRFPIGPATLSSAGAGEPASDAPLQGELR